MKKTLSLLIVLAMLLCGCSELIPPRTTMPTEDPEAVLQAEEATEEPSTETTEPPATEPPPVYTNPLTGEVIDEPFTGRIIAFPISNVYYALPHYCTNQADILMEMWVNGSIIRDIALYTNPYDVPQIGSIRSDRLMFNEIIRQYDAILLDAGGDDRVLSKAEEMNLDRFNIYCDTGAPTYYSFRDMSRIFTFHVTDAYEHALFANGSGLKQLLEEKGFRTTQSENKDYFLHFIEDGTPTSGENAASVSVNFTYSNNRKVTSMLYNEELGKYVYKQYDKEMIDGYTGEPEAFKNVIIMLANIQMVSGGYYEADFLSGGQGYYACGGKLIPITWSVDDDYSPFRFFTEDGNSLNLNVGNTYIAIAPIGSPVTYQ